ncbi:hypothetical protein [Pandoraea apista]|uniref:Uncharacterized protein n=1 Tax=Pandoraea apista TaxID=93218 RepID=A0ABX9ZKN0_9BURK|nr:hypothetical protein [Pandoraea apista]PTE00834.1 hypothetical protein C7830_11395 [Pandoraea apista]RRJ30796.1 hypothetical protein EIB05_13525 [Pandoraea apista]RRJ74576.1 hypothetical protein EIL82_15075 [Pandoraea apista]RSD06388.1 hypothetical protein EJB12_21895 [Pandoraea apista]RSD14541.1 hypothetical protein EIZ52_18075 [Pandoraea apista]
MTTHKMYERNGYFTWVTGVQLDSGKWGAYAYFERIADHSDKEFVPCMRITISGEWDSRQEAETAAKIDALQMADADNTGF